MSFRYTREISYKNCINATSTLYTGSYKSFQILWGKCLNHILTYLNCTKFNKFNMCHSDVHKYVSQKNDINTKKIVTDRLTKTFSNSMGKTFKRI